jgi:quercetin dioxygenase-like cupin family protein
MRFAPTLCVVAICGIFLASSTAFAQKFEVTSIAEKKVSQLPPGSLYWRIETFPTLAEAQAAAGPTGLAAEVDGKAWLFTLGAPSGSSSGGLKVAEIGPVPSISAPEYLLRINSAGGPPGVKTPIHMHPGSESFYVLTGELSQKTPSGERHVEAGHSMPGNTPDTPMEVSSTGTGDLKALVMFVADAAKPFSSPATMQ